MSSQHWVHVSVDVGCGSEIDSLNLELVCIFPTLFIDLQVKSFVPILFLVGINGLLLELRKKIHLFCPDSVSEATAFLAFSPDVQACSSVAQFIIGCLREMGVLFVWLPCSASRGLPHALFGPGRYNGQTTRSRNEYCHCFCLIICLYVLLQALFLLINQHSYRKINCWMPYLLYISWLV